MDRMDSMVGNMVVGLVMQSAIVLVFAYCVIKKVITGKDLLERRIDGGAGKE